MEKVTIPPGQWLIRWRIPRFDLPAIIRLVIEIEQWIELQGWRSSRTEITINPEFHENFFTVEEEVFYFHLKNFRLLPIREGLPGRMAETGDYRQRPIRNVRLAYPVRLNDRRWDTILLPTASLLLGSALSSRHYNVDIKKQVLPDAAPDPDYRDFDLVGLTLFEDLLPETGQWVHRLRECYRGLLAAGGPLITLNPLAAAFHLPELNLLVRGEAELILPGLLKAIAGGDIRDLFNYRGVMFQDKGLVLISDLDTVNRPAGFDQFHFQLDFLKPEHLGQGIEINASRGCGRSCLFCSKVQGQTLRRLPADTFAELLEQFEKKIMTLGVDSPLARTVNINDDDILQDIDYAAGIFDRIKQQGFKLWGIQSAVDSLFGPEGEPDPGVIELLGDRELFVNNQPLLWVGTDTFLKERARRLGKHSFDPAAFHRLLETLEAGEISHYHYWVSSDHHSDWREFVKEFLFICDLQNRFRTFGLLAHAPFVIPYASTPLYRKLKRSAPEFQRIRYRKILSGPMELLDLPLVERLETPYEQLNRLLKNEKAGTGRGFLDYLKEKDYRNALLTVYHFLRQERLQLESSRRQPEADPLKKTEAQIETYLEVN